MTRRIENTDLASPTQLKFRCSHRGRRPLKSKSLCTLLHILSQLDNCGTEIGHVDGSDESGGHNPVESDDVLVQGGLNKEHIERDGLDGMDTIGGNNTNVTLVDNQENQNESNEKNDSHLEIIGGEMPIIGKELEKTTNPNEHKEEKSCHLESIGGGIQRKEKELQEFEDGEISGDAGVYGELMEFLLEDATPLEEKMLDKGKISEEVIENQRVFERAMESTSSTVKSIENVGNNKEVELGINKRKLVEYESELLFPPKIIKDKLAHGLKTGRNKKRADQVMDSDSPATLPIGSSGGNAEIQVTESTEKDADACRKKKRGPPTEERKAKKKQKERIKRAEKNRKLGVKRLKLQPVLKPKTVTYCRHYLQGRCHEGDKCKFSHDTTPLTKSKPCGHFARKSCMKGDNCPFDHELSKYPCNNYISTGSCSRGADCMFSHKMPVKEVSTIASSVSKPELTPVPISVNSIPKQQPNSMRPSSSKTPEQNVAKTIPQPAKQAPKGISFLVHANSPQSNAKHAGSCPKVDNGVKIGHQMIEKRTPKGINFLSFGKAPINDPTTKKSFNFPLIKDQGIGRGEKATNELQNPKTTSDLRYNQSLDQFTDGKTKSTPIFSQGLAQKSLFLNTPSSVQKALRSTLSFAAKFDSGVNMDRSNKTMSASSILDFIYGDRSITKQ